MKFKLEIEMNNAAFIDDPNELSRILKQLGNKLEHPQWTQHSCISIGYIKNLNGNNVGEFAIYSNKSEDLLV